MYEELRTERDDVVLGMLDQLVVWTKAMAAVRAGEFAAQKKAA